MHFFRVISETLRASERQRAVALRLQEISYADVLREQAIYGSPETVAERLRALHERLPFSGFSAWMTCGGQIPHERVLRSMRLFAERVAPCLA